MRIVFSSQLVKINPSPVSAIIISRYQELFCYCSSVTAVKNDLYKNRQFFTFNMGFLIILFLLPLTDWTKILLYVLLETHFLSYCCHGNQDNNLFQCFRPKIISFTQVSECQKVLQLLYFQCLRF